MFHCSTTPFQLVLGKEGKITEKNGWLLKAFFSDQIKKKLKKRIPQGSKGCQACQGVLEPHDCNVHSPLGQVNEIALLKHPLNITLLTHRLLMLMFKT